MAKIRIADDPLAFARATVSLLRSPQERELLAGNAYSLVQARYDSSVVVPRFLRLVESVGYSDGRGMHSVTCEQPNTRYSTKAQ